MIAKLWRDEIVAGRRNYHEVPAKLKPKVRELLIEVRREDLVEE